MMKNKSLLVKKSLHVVNIKKRMNAAKYSFLMVLSGNSFFPTVIENLKMVSNINFIFFGSGDMVQMLKKNISNCVKFVLDGYAVNVVWVCSNVQYLEFVLSWVYMVGYLYECAGCIGMMLSEISGFVVAMLGWMFHGMESSKLDL